ncbi:MAG: RNA polymerase sigma factor [Gemmatimonadales bacterium]
MSNDRALVDRAVGGDAGALESLVVEHRRTALRIATAILGDADLAEDVAQDVMLRMTAALPGFIEGGDLDGWVYRVTVNRSRDHLRGRRRRAGDIPADSAVGHPALASDPRPDAEVDVERARAAMDEALTRLPADQREMIRLRYQVGLAYAEIARVTDTSPGTVASRIFRALKRLGGSVDRHHLEVLE